MQAKPRTSVFIIDDNEMTRTVLRMIVQGEQYHVIGEASSGVAGLERALRLKPDLVCLDIQMPDADGLDVLLTLRARLPDTLVLMVTAQNDHQTVQRALGMGAHGFVVQPLTAGAVLDAIDAARERLASSA